MTSKSTAPKKKFVKSASKTTTQTATTPKTDAVASKTTPKTATTRKTSSQQTTTTPKTNSAKATNPQTTPETTTTSLETAFSKTTSPRRTSLRTPTTSTSSKATTPKITSPETVTAPKTTSPETVTIPQITPKISSPETVVTPQITPQISSPEAATAPETISPETTTTNIPQTTSPKTNTTTPNTTKTSKTAPKTITKIKKKIIKKVIVKRVKTAPELPPEAKEEKEEEKSQLSVEEEARFSNPDQSIEVETPAAQCRDPPDLLNSVNLDSENLVAENDEEKGAAVESENEKGGEVGNESEKGGEGMEVGEEDVRASERHPRRKTEIFIGGLDKDAKEEDIRKVFEKVGEVLEIRLMMNSQTGKNKGYAFLRYASPTDAKRAITELAKAEVCGKQCGAAALEGNDTIFLGNIDKKWKTEDVMKLLQEIGIENIDTLTVMTDHNNSDCNRGFAFLELETNKDAQIAYKKLQKRDVFGKDRNIKVSWAEPLNEPDEEEMRKVKSVYVEGIPSSWDEEKVRRHFKKLGEIERITLSRNIQSARRKDFAFVNYVTRESALACIESFNKEELIDEGSKVNLKVSLAKPAAKSKQSKGGSKSVQKDYSKEKPKAVNRDTNVNFPFNKGKSVRASANSGVDKKSSTNHELIQVLRQQAAHRQGYMGLGQGSALQGYVHTLPGEKRPFAALGGDIIYSDSRGYPRARFDSSFAVATSSYSMLSHSMSGTSLPYYQQPGSGYAAGTPHGTTGHSSASQMRQGAAPYGSGFYPR